MSDSREARQAGRALDALEDPGFNEVARRKEDAFDAEIVRPAQTAETFGHVTPIKALAMAAALAESPRRWLAVRVPPGEWRDEVTGWCDDAKDLVQQASRVAVDYADTECMETQYKRRAAVAKWLAALLTDALEAMEKEGDPAP